MTINYVSTGTQKYWIMDNSKKHVKNIILPFNSPANIPFTASHTTAHGGTW